MLKKLQKLLLLFSIIFMSSSCSYLSDCYSYGTEFYRYLAEFPSFYVSEANVLTLQIESSRSPNDGTPFYVFIRPTDFAEFLRDDYLSITALVGSEDPGAMICIIPGTTKTIKVKICKDKSTAVYCLFTEPGEIWKHIIDHEDRSLKVKMVLSEHEIKSINIL